MKIRSILCGLFAVAAISACKQEEPVVQPALDVNKTSALVSAAGEELTIEVTSNVDWTASADQDWVSVDPSSGKGSADAAKVKVTVDPNEAEETRAAVVTVVADQLTKTLKITQAGANAPEPETYILVGEAVGGWDPVNNGVILILEDGYYVAKAVSVTAKKGMHFTKNAAWEGNVKGKHGLIAPNEIGEVGSNDISLTESGKFDVYLTEALDKFYFMSEGKLPSEAVEHVDIKVEWGMMGMFVDNEWGTDVPMEYEGEWIVAKGANFSNLAFKIRGNGSWTDATNIGVAPGSEKGVVNGKISVVTAEYSKANLGGDAADIKLNGAAGTYDVYFSFENLEVYVMEQGYKPGEKEPQNPDPVEVTYTVTGTLEGINWNNAAPEGLMTLEGDYYVAKNVPFVWASNLYETGGADQIEFKICETGTWDAYGVSEGTPAQEANAEISVVAGGGNVVLMAAEGAYDVYFDKANGKVWVMAPGYKPGETPEPAEYEIDGKQWVFEWQGMGGASCVIDLGVTQPGMAILAYDMGVLDPSYSGIYYPYIFGEYSVAKTDGTSGVITLSADGSSVEIPYSKATANSVHFESAALLEGENIDCTLATTLIGIEFGAAQGLADGEYWIIADNKVATPLTKNYGYLDVVDAVGGKSTAANAFTFTQVDAGLYTIQDSNGKYYYQTGNYNSFNVADEDGMTDEFLWEVYDSGNGQFVIMNYEVGKFIQYSTEYNSYGSYPDERGILPYLVLAENPVEDQPEVPADPAVKETIWKGEPFDLGSDWSKGLQIHSVPRLPEDARIHVVYEAPAGYDYYQFKFCYVDQEWQWVPLTSPTGMNADGCVTLDAAATEYSFALNAEDIAAINTGRGLVVQGYAAIIKEVYYTSEIEVGDGPKVIWEGREELLSDWSTGLQIQNMPHLESGMSIYVEYEASGYDYYQFKFCYIDQNWGWIAMTSPVDVNEYGCVMLDPQKTEYVLALNDEDIAAINAGKGMVIQGYGAVITKVSYK